MDADRDTCPSCIGTGIGNPHVERSVCSACHGRGVIRAPSGPVDEDRWAWNHFELEPGEDDAAALPSPIPHPLPAQANDGGEHA